MAIYFCVASTVSLTDISLTLLLVLFDLLGQDTLIILIGTCSSMTSRDYRHSSTQHPPKLRPNSQ